MKRRELLTGLAVASVTVACATDKSDGSKDGGTKGGSSKGGGTKATKPTKVTAAEPKSSELGDGAFSLGVASGDPLSDRVMLWTRVMTDDADAAAGDIEVAFDVSKDENFDKLVISDIAVAKPELVHSLHVDVTELEPDTWYFYRFRAGGKTSPVARTRTFPAEDAKPDSFKFVFATCQDYQWGQYAAWKRAGEQPDLDAVVFLGDYIYESNYGDLSPDKSGVRVWDTPEAMTLDDYRARYAQVKADPSIQSLHHMLPWIITFDDHEVSDNYAGDFSGNDIDTPTGHDRRVAAYQAWYEHTPIRIDPTPTSDFSELQLNRGFAFGTLAKLHVIETRQNADRPPCRTTSGLTADEGGACPEMFDEDRTNLGKEQEDWLHKSISSSKTKWNILANPVMLAGMNIGSPEAPEFYRDMWDGYRASRTRLLKAITESSVSNPVTITGDWHASFVLDVLSEPHVQDSAPVMPEFLVTAISSVLFPQDYTAANPHIRYFHAEHGYCVMTVEAEQATCEFHYISDVWDPDAPVTTVDKWAIKDGERQAVKA